MTHRRLYALLILMVLALCVVEDFWRSDCPTLPKRSVRVLTAGNTGADETASHEHATATVRTWDPFALTVIALFSCERSAPQPKINRIDTVRIHGPPSRLALAVLDFGFLKPFGASEHVCRFWRRATCHTSCKSFSHHPLSLFVLNVVENNHVSVPFSTEDFLTSIPGYLTSWSTCAEPPLRMKVILKALQHNSLPVQVSLQRIGLPCHRSVVLLPAISRAPLPVAKKSMVQPRTGPTKQSAVFAGSDVAHKPRKHHAARTRDRQASCIGEDSFSRLGSWFVNYFSSREQRIGGDRLKEQNLRSVEGQRPWISPPLPRLIC